MAKRGGFPGGAMPGNMANLMKQAQRMQRQMEEGRKELESTEFSGSAGGDAVKVTINGARDVLSISLDKDIVDPDDVELLLDYGYTCDEIEEMFIDSDLLRETLNAVKNEENYDDLVHLLTRKKNIILFIDNCYLNGCRSDINS